MTDDRLPWFHCFPSKLLGAIASMKPDQKLVYLVMLLRIYEVRGPCPDTLDAIAIRCGINRRRASDAVDALFRAEKLVREPAGIINPFAVQILAKGDALHRERQRAGAAGGSSRAEKRKPNQSTPPSKAKAAPKQLDSDSDRDSEEGKDKTLFAPGALPAEWPKDYREQFWNQYPRKTEKKAALAKLDVIRKAQEIPWARFIAGVTRYAAHVAGDEERYIKHPTTWLNRGCWDDVHRPRRPDRGGTNGLAALALDLNLGRQHEET